MFISTLKRQIRSITLVAILALVTVACSTADPGAPIEVTVIKEVEVVKEVVKEVEKEVEVIKEVTVEVPVTVEVVKEMETFVGDYSTAPVFAPYDHDTHVGESKLWRSADSIHTEYAASGLTPGHAMTLWFVLFNHPENCDGMCGPPDFGADAGAMGDMMPVPGAGAVVGDDGTVSFSGSLSMGDTSGSGIGEKPEWCQADGCGDPVGLVNPEGALVIVALHSHGPASDDADTLALQTSSYLGGCDRFSGTLPAGLAGSVDEIPDEAGDCSTILESPHLPAAMLAAMEAAMADDMMDDTMMEGTTSEAPVFAPYDHDTHVGTSTLVRTADDISTEYTVSGLTPGHAMTLWFVLFNHPEECDGMCGPADFGADAGAMGDMMPVPGAGAVVGSDGRLSFSGSLSVGDTSGSGIGENPEWCQADGCGEPVGLVNPEGALVIVALHSHGPASDDADTLALQTSSYLGGCDRFSGTLPAGLAGSVDEIPDEAGECSTILESPHLPAAMLAAMEAAMADDMAMTMDEKMANAMSAAPAPIAQGATILDYSEEWPGNWPDEPAPEMVELHAGDNGWTCIVDIPTTPGNDPMCLNETYFATLMARYNLVESPSTGIGFGYMLQGGGPVGSPPHMMVFTPESNDSVNTYDTEPGPYPWIMFPETSHQHLMVLVTPPADVVDVADDAMANAMSAAPAPIAADATILEYSEAWPGNWPDEPAPELVEVRAGTNGWTCIADIPTTPGNDPMCLNETYFETLMARYNLVDSPSTGIGFGYMLQGGGPVGSPPHMMVFAPASNASVNTYDTEPGPFPWIMFPETTHQHLMVLTK